LQTLSHAATAYRPPGSGLNDQMGNHSLHSLHSQHSQHVQPPSMMGMPAFASAPAPAAAHRVGMQVAPGNPGRALAGMSVAQARPGPVTGMMAMGGMSVGASTSSSSNASANAGGYGGYAGFHVNSSSVAATGGIGALKMTQKPSVFDLRSSV
jgi:hypothetical protein